MQGFFRPFLSRSSEHVLWTLVLYSTCTRTPSSRAPRLALLSQPPFLPANPRKIHDRLISTVDSSLPQLSPILLASLSSLFESWLLIYCSSSRVRAGRTLAPLTDPPVKSVWVYQQQLHQKYMKWMHCRHFYPVRPTETTADSQMRHLLPRSLSGGIGSHPAASDATSMVKYACQKSSNQRIVCGAHPNALSCLLRWPPRPRRRHRRSVSLPAAETSARRALGTTPPPIVVPPSRTYTLPFGTC